MNNIVNKNFISLMQYIILALNQYFDCQETLTIQNCINLEVTINVTELSER